MEKKEQVRLLKELLRHRDQGSNVDAGGLRRNPAQVYTCPELASRERESFFRQYPQIIGLSGDLPAPGSFVTRDDFGVPILAARDPEGRFRAFVNSCRHRGAQVETRPRGQQLHFACPFHGWTYSNRGELVSIPKPRHFGHVERSGYGLLPLPAVERFGLLWVHPDPAGALDPEALLGGLGSEFDSWGFGDYVFHGEDSYDMRLNWKLAMDTFGETYHFDVLHRSTLALSFYGNAQCYDVFDRNHRMVLCLQGLDGLRGRPEADWHITDGGFPVYYLFPNIQLNVGQGGIILVRAYPDAETPGRSISRISFYAKPQVAATEPAEAIDLRFRVFGEVVRDEDYRVAETIQRSAEAGRIDHVLFGRNEPALHHYHQTYRQALGLPPLPLIRDSADAPVVDPAA